MNIHFNVEFPINWKLSGFRLGECNQLFSDDSINFRSGGPAIRRWRGKLKTSTSFILWSEERAINLSHYEEWDIQILPILQEIQIWPCRKGGSGPSTTESHPILWLLLPPQRKSPKSSSTSGLTTKRGGGVKALVVGPLVEALFLRLSLHNF